MASFIDLKYSLPEELWIDILKHVSSADALNVIRKYPHISSAVQPYKAHLLFGKVVPFLIDWSFRDKWWEGFPITLLTLPDLRSCRLVCKNWCSEIDLIFQTVETNVVDPAQSWQSNLKWVKLKKYDWTSSFDVEFTTLTDFPKFTKQFKTLAGNRDPFPSRSFVVFIKNSYGWDPEMEDLEKTEENLEAEYNQHWTLLINFLRKFGTHIRKFTLETGLGRLKCENLNGIFELKNLAKCLRLLPNLQSFCLDIIDEVKWIFNSLAELETTMASEFMDTPKLEIASFCFINQEPQLCTSFLNLFSQSIKRLFVELHFDPCQPPAMPALIFIDVSTRKYTDSEEIDYVNLLAKMAPNLRMVTFAVLDENKPWKTFQIERTSSWSLRVKN